MSHIKMRSGKGAIIANPNCSTIIALMAVTPLDRIAKVRATRPPVLTAESYLQLAWLGTSLLQHLLYSCRPAAARDAVLP